MAGKSIIVNELGDIIIVSHVSSKEDDELFSQSSPTHYCGCQIKIIEVPGDYHILVCERCLFRMRVHKEVKTCGQFRQWCDNGMRRRSAERTELRFAMESRAC